MITTNAFDYINVLDKAADASWLRETAIMNNLANTDTPGYKRQEVDFESVLQRELGHSKYTTLDKKIRSLNADLSGLNVSTYTDHQIILTVWTKTTWIRIPRMWNWHRRRSVIRHLRTASPLILRECRQF